MSEKRTGQSEGDFAGAALMITVCIFVGNIARLAHRSINSRNQKGADGSTTSCTRRLIQSLHTRSEIAPRPVTRVISDASTASVHRLWNILQKHGRRKIKPLHLTKEEDQMSQDIIDPDDMDTGFADVGGLDELKQEVWELAVLPMRKPEVFHGTSSKLIKRSPGIILFGAPGCGKTLLAKAIAKESGAVFIPIELSRLLCRYWGESEKLVEATFSLARKVAPSVIFFDEMDSVFNKENDSTNTSRYLDCIKNCFLANLDGISSHKKGPPVLVFGATNRPQSIDPAILRRFPRAFEVPLPHAEGREQILQILLQEQAMDDTAKAFVTKLAKELTEGYSGSDLRELCSAAAMQPVREVYAEVSKRAVQGLDVFKNEEDYLSHEEQEAVVSTARPLTEKDFLVALEKVKRTGKAAADYGERQMAPPAELSNSFYI